MAIVLNLPDRRRATPLPAVVTASRRNVAAEVVILPCVRREPLDVAAAGSQPTFPAAVRQA